MTNRTPALGGRLPLVDGATMTGAQRALSESLKASWEPWASKLGVKVTTSDGQLIGPFNSFLLHPPLAAKLAEFLAAETAHTTLPERVRQVIIVVVGAVWVSAYELYAHCAAAGAAGLSARAVDVLANGGIPDELSASEEIAARFARGLSTARRIDDALYAAAVQAFGATGVFDIGVLIGQHHAICSLFALFDVPAPPDAE